jgi:protein subunit release factor B
MSACRYIKRTLFNIEKKENEKERNKMEKDEAEETYGRQRRDTKRQEAEAYRDMRHGNPERVL